MKKLILSSITLILFSLAIIVFQISCKKEIIAQSGGNYVLPPATTTTLGGVIIDGITIQVDSKGKIAQARPTLIFFSRTNESNIDEIWRANIDGSNQQKLNIVLPNDYEPSINSQHEGGSNPGAIKVTTDQKIIFLAHSNSIHTYSLFTCDFDGSNVVKIIDKVGTSYDTN